MSAWRRQPPAYSPLNASAVLAGWSPGDVRPELRNLLAGRYGSAEVVLTQSGTTALSLALRAAVSRRPGLPCVLPAYGCYDLASAAIGAGVSVRLYDLDPRTLGPDEESLRRALEGGAAALVAVHLYGVPAPLREMQVAAERAGALLIEDAAQGAGGSDGDAPLGASGALGILSFGRGKGMTGGGGGALLVREAQLAEQVMDPGPAPGVGLLSSLLFASKVTAQWALGRPSLYRLPTAIPGLSLGETLYHPPEAPGALTRAAARILMRTIPLSDGEAAVRRRNAERLMQAMRGSTSFHAVEVTPGSRPGWLRLPMLAAAAGGDVSARWASQGAQLGYPLPLSRLPQLADRIERRALAPGADLLARHLVTFPTHSLLTEDDLRQLEAILKT